MNEMQRLRRVTAYIERNLDGDLTLARLSREAGVSRFHLQRSFKAAVGVTPKQYAEACRLRSLKANLRSGGDVLESTFAAGFGSSSRVYERVNTRLGMTPAEYRKQGATVPVTHATVPTSLGLLMIGATDRGVCFVQFGESEAELEAQLRREYPAAQLDAARHPWPKPLADWIAALEQHLKGSRPRPGASPGRSGNRVSDARVAVSAIHPLWRNEILRPSGARYRQTVRVASGCASLRKKSHRSGSSPAIADP